MNIEFWKAAGIRAFRTFLQVILAVWTAGQLITEVDWKFLLLSAFSSAVYSLLTSILAGLPEVSLQNTLYDLDNDPDEEDAVTYARLLGDAKPLLDAESEIKPGDVVSIDMYAVKEEDGDLTKRDVSISVGSGTGPEEIEEALIGMWKNEEKKVTVTYPEDYLYMGLNGKTIEYKVIVNSIARPDEPTEVEIGKALAYLKEETERINRERLTEAVKRAFIENSEITAYPEKVIRQARSRYERKYLAGFESLEDFLDLTGMTREEFKDTENEYVSQRAKEQLVLKALQEETGITTSSDAYRQYTAIYGVNGDDPDKTLFEVIVEEIRERLDLVESITHRLDAGAS